MSYEHLLLRRNLVPSPVADADLFFERTESKKIIQRILFNQDSMKIRTSALVCGRRGSGKSHFLSHLRSRIFREINVHSIELDFLFARTPFQLYTQVVEGFSKSNCLDDFLTFLTLPDGFVRLKNMMNAPTCLSVVYLRVGKDKAKLRSWLYGQMRDDPFTLPSIEESYIEVDILACLLRFYYCIWTERSYPVLTADHCETLVDDLVTYVRSSEKIEMGRLLATMMDLSTCVFAVDSDKIDDFMRVLHPKSSSFDRHELQPLAKVDVGVFLSDARSAFVDLSMSVGPSETPENESLSMETYPLTREAQTYVENLDPIQPGQLVNIVQKAMEISASTGYGYIVTRKNVEIAVLEREPTLLCNCRDCGRRLKMAIAFTRSSSYGRAGEIEHVDCPECGGDVRHLASIVLRTIVLDSSCFANSDFSLLLNYFANLRTMKIRVIVPAAVSEELSAWEKKEEKRMIYRIARAEYQNLVSLDTQKRIDLELDVGRKPTPFEKKEALVSNPIDRIIIDVARINGATLLTRDQGMAASSFGKVRFVLLFRGN